MYLDGKQQVELKVEQLNQRLTELGIPQLRFEFEPKLSLIRLTYQKKPCFDVIDYEISDYYDDLIEWLNYHEGNLFLYQQLVSHFKGAFARLIKLDDGSLGLTSNGLTYQFGYLNGQLLVVCSKNYEKDLLELGTKFDEMKLERVIVPKEKNLMWTKCSVGKMIHETEVEETLLRIESDYKNFEDMFVYQTAQITDN
jgi:hypothetical protein